ncbi:MAG TPA: porin [Gammaproteobacteria bacterium]|nr:porin [Gammaproteobacteria bacterium]
MLKAIKKTALVAGCVAALGAATSAQAANWLMLQGTERAGAAPRAKVWGFVQPEIQSTDGTLLKAGPFSGQNAIFNVIRPDNKSNETFNIRRARIGIRGTGFPPDSRVNYFFLAEFGNNGITRPGGGTGSAKITDASVTLNHIKGMRVRVGQFKTPGAEEGLAAIHVFDYINFTNFAFTQLLERYFNGDGSTTPGNAAGTCGGVTASCANLPNGPVGAFRDVGIQLFDTFKDGDWEHSYAIMYGNGNGITRGDNDDNKDTYLYWSSELVYGGRGPRRQGWKLFAWSQTGKRTLTGANAAGGTGGAGEYDRDRSGFGTTYRRGQHRAAFEYFTADGMIFNGTDGGAIAGSTNNGGTGIASFNVATTGEADGYYIHYGYAPNPKWEFDIRYDIMNRLTNSTTGERKFETTTLGVQYFFNKKSRFVFNYEIRSAEAPNLAGSATPNVILDSIDDRLSAELLIIF